MFGVQLYKNNARVLLSRILSILYLDWLQHVRSVRGVYEYVICIQQMNGSEPSISGHLSLTAGTPEYGAVRLVETRKAM